MKRRVLDAGKKINLFDIFLATGKIVSPDDFVVGESALGVVFLIENGYAHIVYLSDVAGGWAYYGPNSAVGNGITSTSNTSIAKMDYDGQKNMDAVIASGRLSNSPAFNLCHNLLNGAWYLPGLGELVEIYNNLSKLENLLLKIGGRQFVRSSYWSSTEYSATEGWWVQFGDGGLNHYTKTATWTPGYVRPVTKIRAVY